MHIGLITSSFLPQIGGLEWKVHYLAAEYERRGHEVTVFHRKPRSRSWRPLSITPSYRISPVGFRPFPGYIRSGMEEWFFARHLRAFHRNKPLDVLHCHNLELPTKYGVGLKASTGLPVLATTCGHDILTASGIGFGARLRPSFDRIVRENVQRVNVVGSISDAITAELRAIGAKAAILEIPNGVDWPTFQIGRTGWLKSRLGINCSDLLLASVGRNHPVKDYATGIKAFAEVAGRDRRLHYAIVGKDTLALEPLVNSLGLHGRVHLIGGVPMEDMPKVLWGCDVFVSTSLLEGFPQVVVQAMSCARPCVLTDCPGNVDFEKYKCAVFGKAGDPRSVAAALKWMVSHPEKRRLMGRNAHLESRRFSWRRIADEYLGALENLANHARSESAPGAPFPRNQSRIAGGGAEASTAAGVAAPARS